MHEGFVTPSNGPLAAAATPMAPPSQVDGDNGPLGPGAEVPTQPSGEVGQANAAELAVLLEQFRRRIDDPLLALPDPTVVRRRLFSVSKPATRRSKRIAARGKGVASSVVKRAQRILMHKLGICREEDRLSETQLKEYAAIFASPLGPEQIEAISTLFGLTCVRGADDIGVDAVEA
jgi:hypothetical protein